VLIAWALLLTYNIPRWYMFLLFFLFTTAWLDFLSAYLRLCPVMSALGLYVRTQKNGKSAEVPIACPLVLKTNRKRGRRIWWYILPLSLGCTLVCFASTYIVEAASGQVRYD
jgi:hypothetical protein